MHPPKTNGSVKSGDAVRCAIYTRKSTDEGLDRDFNSLEAQREAAEAYITLPVTTLGALLGDSTYITEVKVDKVSVEKGIIVYQVVSDVSEFQGKYVLV